MGWNRKIHDFALRYRELYSSPETTIDDVVNGFEDQCLNFEFSPIIGYSAIEAVTKNAFYVNDEVRQVVGKMIEVDLIGSVIFSRWRHIVYAEDPASLFDQDCRSWFVRAFQRLAELTDQEEESPCFRGTLKKIQLHSDNWGYGPCPDPDEEIEQHLTITADGRIWLSRYRFGEPGHQHELIEKLHYFIPRIDVDEVMDVVSSYFRGGYDFDFVTDVGSWSLALTNTNDQVFRWRGSVYSGSRTGDADLSDIIRAKLGRNDLFVFDGNPNSITIIEVEYHKTQKKTRGSLASEETDFDTNETLKIDRASGMMEYTREIESGSRVTRLYTSQNDIAKLLDGFPANIFSDVEGNPPDVVENPHEIRDYTIKVYDSHGKRRVISGTFDKYGLPSDWPMFSRDVDELMSIFDSGELFDRKVYGKIRRKQSEYIFCNVEFEDGGQTYCYLADRDEYCEGDFVVVPVGVKNIETVVRIASIMYLPEENAPYPMEKIKHVIRKIEK